MKPQADFCGQRFLKWQPEVAIEWFVTSTLRAPHAVAHALYLSRLWLPVPGCSCACANAESADHGAAGGVTAGRLGTHSKHHQLLRGGADGGRRGGAEAARPGAPHGL